MSGLLKLCLMVYWIGLVLWLAALVSAAVAAMNVFPALDGLPLALEAYPAYPGSEHPRLAAGIVMDGVFFTVDILQFTAIPLVLLTLALQLTFFRLPARRPANAVRAVCIVIAAAFFAYHAAALAPKMNRALRAFWTAAEAGDVDAAHAHRAAFNDWHPTADLLLRADLLLLVVAVLASAAAVVPRHTHVPGRLEPPMLLKGRP